jgi:hypothetical protein
MVNFALFNQKQLHSLKSTSLLADFDEILVYEDNEKLSDKVNEQLATKIGSGDMLHIDSASISIAPPEDFSRLLKLLTSRNAQLRLWFPESEFQISCLINCSDIIIEKTAQKHLKKLNENKTTCQRQLNHSHTARLTNRELDALMKTMTDGWKAQ